MWTTATRAAQWIRSTVINPKLKEELVHTAVPQRAEVGVDGVEAFGGNLAHARVLNGGLSDLADATAPTLSPGHHRQRHRPPPRRPRRHVSLKTIQSPVLMMTPVVETQNPIAVGACATLYG